MSISLNSYAVGDTNYIVKMNSDMTQIQAAVNAQEGALTGALAGGTNAGFGQIWKDSGMVGASSFVMSLNSDVGLSFTSGAVWHFGTKNLGVQTANQLLNFAGKSAAQYFINADTAGNLTFSTASSLANIYTISFDAPSFTSLTRLSPFLFDGEDYLSVLSSNELNLSFTNLAHRLSTIEANLSIDAQFAQHKESGLTWDYKSGRVRTDATITSAACATITLSTAATHYIEVDPSNGNVSHTSEGGFTNSFIPLRVISTAAGAVVSNADMRTWAVMTFSGGGGAGVLKNSGTPDTIWKYNQGGACTISDTGLTVIRGSDTNVEIRWNETNDKWEFTNDGTSYAEFNNINNLNIGAGSTMRYVAVASQPLLIDLTDVDPTSDPADSGWPVIDASAHISTTTTAVLLRGYCLDSNASAMTVNSQYGVNFSLDSSTTTNNAAQMIFATTESGFMATQIVVPVSTGTFMYRVDASSDVAMHVIKIALLGYWDTVTGVGTQVVSAKANSGATTNLSVATSTNDFELSSADFSAVLNRGLIHYLAVSGTIGAGSLYDVEIYNSNVAGPDLLFQAINIDASAEYITRMPFFYTDAASDLKVYVRISNAGASAGLFTFEMRGERFA